MLEEDRTAICGPRYAHQPDRIASRAGTVPSEVVLGGRKVALARPRVRTAAGDALDLVALLLDGVHVGEHCLLVALGMAAAGEKHVLGLWEGSTENTAVCQSIEPRTDLL